MPKHIAGKLTEELLDTIACVKRVEKSDTLGFMHRHVAHMMLETDAQEYRKHIELIASIFEF